MSIYDLHADGGGVQGSICRSLSSPFSPNECQLKVIIVHILTLDILFRQITTFIKVHVAVVFGLQVL